MKNRYEIRGDVTAIFINCGGEMVETLIDTEDFNKVDAHPNLWCGAKQSNGMYYASGRFTVDKKTTRYFMHRLIMDTPDDLVVDHINHNMVDNRKSNLRNVTHQQNLQNISTYYKSKSGVRGVRWEPKSNKWRACVAVMYKNHTIGLFDTKEEAEEAVKIARAKMMPYSIESQELDVSDIETVFSKNHLSQPRSHNTSGYRNVSYHKGSNKWRVTVKNKHYGKFADINDAINHAINVRKELGIC